MIYTKSQRRVLDVVKAEIRERGRCVLSLAEMAEQARTSRSTTSLAIRRARAAGDIRVKWRQVDGLCNVIVEGFSD